MSRFASPLTPLVVAAAALLQLGAAGHPARALEPREMIDTAKVACLQSAGRNGWQTDTAEVITARTLDADRVEVIFNLTRDGANKARLTCPYSISKGVMGALGEATVGVLEPLPPPPLAVPVDRHRAWWLLLPIGLGLLSWAALRGRDGDRLLAGTGTAAAPETARGGPWRAEAAGSEGLVDVRQQADSGSAVLHRVRNGDSLSLSGLRRGEWLELSQGGWVRERDLRHDRGSGISD
ncbi:MAG: SH3 domain-containing protein [Cyanobacteriota bacterium]|nr:SH3 domain-containing protein [Cyanobacteriota bacterium]